MDKVTIGQTVLVKKDQPYPYWTLEGIPVTVESIAPDGAFFGKAENGIGVWRWDPNAVEPEEKIP